MYEEGGREETEKEDIEEKVGETGEEDMEEGEVEDESSPFLSSKLMDERSIGGRATLEDVHEDMQHGGLKSSSSSSSKTIEERSISGRVALFEVRSERSLTLISYSEE